MLPGKRRPRVSVSGNGHSNATLTAHQPARRIASRRGLATLFTFSWRDGGYFVLDTAEQEGEDDQERMNVHTVWEWLKVWAYEIHDMALIGRIGAPMQLAAVPGIDEELDGAAQSVNGT